MAGHEVDLNDTPLGWEVVPGDLLSEFRGDHAQLAGLSVEQVCGTGIHADLVHHRIFVTAAMAAAGDMVISRKSTDADFCWLAGPRDRGGRIMPLMSQTRMNAPTVTANPLWTLYIVRFIYLLPPCPLVRPPGTVRSDMMRIEGQSSPRTAQSQCGTLHVEDVRWHHRAGTGYGFP